MMLTNVLVVGPVAMLAPLRENNYVIFATHAFFDLINGFAWVAWGVYRSMVYYAYVLAPLMFTDAPSETDGEMTTPWHCLWQVHSIARLFSRQVGDYRNRKRAHRARH